MQVMLFTGSGSVLYAGGHLDQRQGGGLPTLMQNKGLQFNPKTAMKMAGAETITLTSADHSEGIAVLRESRPPIFEDK